MAADGEADGAWPPPGVRPIRGRSGRRERPVPESIAPASRPDHGSEELARTPDAIAPAAPEGDDVWPPPDVRPGVRPGRGRRRGRPIRTGDGRGGADPRERGDGTLPVGAGDVRSLIGDATTLLVVDGYNLARAAWADLPPEEERRRTVALLEEHRARTGATVVVVFDGADDVVSPLASRSVRVRYSASGVTADDVIAEVVAAAARDRPVVVVSSDRAVADHARGRGATSVPAPAFLAALGR